MAELTLANGEESTQPDEARSADDFTDDSDPRGPRLASGPSLEETAVAGVSRIPAERP